MSDRQDGGVRSAVLKRIGLSGDRFRGTLEQVAAVLTDHVLEQYPDVFLEVEHTGSGAVFRLTGQPGQLEKATEAVTSSFSETLAGVMRVR